MRQIAFFAVTALLVSPLPSAAQDTPRFGVVIGYPAAIGLIWNVSSRLAVRPEVNWTQSSSESTSTTSIILIEPGQPLIPTTITTTTTIDGWQVGIGVSGLIYLSKGDALRTYVSPRYIYSRGSTTIDPGNRPTLSPVERGPTTTVTSNYGASGSFGAQYSLAKRFGLFGEVGLSYNHSGDRSSPSVSPFFQSDVKSWSVALRSGVGVILYFGS